MRFERDILKQILISIFKEYKDDIKKQESFEKFIDVISPESYAPYLGIEKHSAMLKIIKLLNEELESWISYFLYEAPFFWEKSEGATITLKNSKKFNIMNQAEAIQFILNECDFTK